MYFNVNNPTSKERFINELTSILSSHNTRLPSLIIKKSLRDNPNLLNGNELDLIASNLRVYVYCHIDQFTSIYDRYYLRTLLEDFNKNINSSVVTKEKILRTSRKMFKNLEYLRNKAFEKHNGLIPFFRMFVFNLRNRAHIGELNKSSLTHEDFYHG